MHEWVSQRGTVYPCSLRDGGLPAGIGGVLCPPMRLDLSRSPAAQDLQSFDMPTDVDQQPTIFRYPPTTVNPILIPKTLKLPRVKTLVRYISGEVLALRAHVHTGHTEAEMGRVRFPKLQSDLWCDLLTVQWPK